MGKEKKKSLMSYNKFDILSNDALDQRVMQAREVNFTRYKMMIMTLKFKLKKRCPKKVFLFNQEIILDQKWREWGNHPLPLNTKRKKETLKKRMKFLGLRGTFLNYNLILCPKTMFFLLNNMKRMRWRMAWREEGKIIKESYKGCLDQGL